MKGNYSDAFPPRESSRASDDIADNPAAASAPPDPEEIPVPTGMRFDDEQTMLLGELSIYMRSFGMLSILLGIALLVVGLYLFSNQYEDYATQVCLFQGAFTLLIGALTARAGASFARLQAGHDEAGNFATALRSLKNLFCFQFILLVIGVILSVLSIPFFLNRLTKR